ncbi:proline-rich receptor-like protein kinase PERK1 [Micropterus salmoides]|uniref:proline-rich receptor-like protein kinase PERK1 n=1 Tax=Micropterus salmoides TaxID=27706 RepID=UPI0018EE3607|nr:proline-rich receptor-like protein kinase PERK1 [Micropterus salmoides]
MKIYSCLLAFVLCCNVSAETSTPPPPTNLTTPSPPTETSTPPPPTKLTTPSPPTETSTPPPPPPTNLTPSPPTETSTPPSHPPTNLTTPSPPTARRSTPEFLSAATTAPSTLLVNTETSTVSTTQPTMSDPLVTKYRLLLYGLVSGIGTVLLIIIIVLSSRRCRSNRQDGSSQNSPFYANLIHNPPETGNNAETPPDESLYSSIWKL